MTITANKDQQEFIGQMVHVAEYWLGPKRDARLEPLPERLDGLVFSLFPELEGAGGLEQHRLSPKGRPDVNLVDHYLHDQWPDVDVDDQDVRTFLTAVAALLRRAQTDGGEPRAAMGGLLVALCRLIEDSYELVPQFFDEDGDGPVEEGNDVAPGLAAAIESAWAAS